MQAEGLRRGEEVVFADEMQLGMLRQVRRVWGRRGEKWRGRVELRYEWVYLVLGVDPIRGLGEAGAGGGDSSGAQGVVWGHVAFPKAKAVGEGGRPTLMSPAKRVFAGRFGGG